MSQRTTWRRVIFWRSDFFFFEGRRGKQFFFGGVHPTSRFTLRTSFPEWNAGMHNQPHKLISERQHKREKEGLGFAYKSKKEQKEQKNKKTNKKNKKN